MRLQLIDLLLEYKPGCVAPARRRSPCWGILQGRFAAASDLTDQERQGIRDALVDLGLL